MIKVCFLAVKNNQDFIREVCIFYPMLGNFNWLSAMLFQNTMLLQNFSQNKSWVKQYFFFFFQWAGNDRKCKTGGQFLVVLSCWWLYFHILECSEFLQNLEYSFECFVVMLRCWMSSWEVRVWLCTHPLAPVGRWLHKLCKCSRLPN